jgi:hypothetical protein
MTPVLVPFQIDHLRQVKARAPLELGVCLQRVDALMLLGPAYTGMVGDQVLGCAGIVRLWPGVGEAWTIFSDEVCRHPLWLQKAVKTVIGTTMLTLSLSRLQAVARADSERNCRWLQSLGFTWEGNMPKFGSDGATYARYARIHG